MSCSVTPACTPAFRQVHLAYKTAIIVCANDKWQALVMWDDPVQYLHVAGLACFLRQGCFALAVLRL